MTQYSDCECGIANAASRIVNGVPTEENEYPWQVVVYGGGFCGGTIIGQGGNSIGLNICLKTCTNIGPRF